MGGTQRLFMLKKCSKTLFIYSLILCLIEVGSPVIFPAAGHLITSVSAEEAAIVEEAIVEAPSTSRDHSFQDSLSFYKNVSLAQSPRNVFDTNGKSVLDWTQNFINDEANADALETEEGKELLAYHNKFLTYQETKERLEKCMEDAREQYNGQFLGWEFDNVEKYAKDAEKRILGGLIATDKASFDCHRGLVEKSSLDDLFQATLISTNTLNQTSFQEGIYDNSFKKVIAAWLNTRFTYDPEFAKDGNLTADEKAEMQMALCNNDGCSDKQAEMIDVTAQQIVNTLHNSEMTRFSPEEAQSDINTRINTLNDLVEGRELDTRRAWLKLGLGRTVDRDGEETLESVQFYQQEYLKLSTSGAGSLMWTDSIQDASGAMKGVRDWEWDGNNARLGNHGAVSKSDVEKGIQDVLRNIKEQAQKINQYERERVNTENYFKEGNLDNRGAKTLRGRLDSQLEEYVNLNPSIVGEALARSPNMANKVCAAIHENIRSGRAKQRFNNTVMGVTVAAAAALVVSGVGSAAGVALFTGVSSTMLLGAGVAIGAVDMAHTGNQWRQAAKNRQAVMNTYFAGVGDEYTLIQAKEAIDEYESAQTNFYWAAGFTALDLATLGASRIARANPALVRKAAAAYNRLGGGRLNSLLSSAMKGASNTTKAGYRLVIDRIAHSSLSARFLDVLEGLNDSAFKRVLDRLMGVNQRFCTPGQFSCGAFDEIIDDVGARNTTTLTEAELNRVVDESIARNGESMPSAISEAPSRPETPPIGEEFVDNTNGIKTTIYEPPTTPSSSDIPGNVDDMIDITPRVDTEVARPNGSSRSRAVDPGGDTTAPIAPRTPEIVEELPTNRALVSADEVLPATTPSHLEAPVAPVEPLAANRALTLYTDRAPRVQSTAIAQPQVPVVRPTPPELNTIIIPEPIALPPPSRAPVAPRVSAVDELSVLPSPRSPEIVTSARPTVRPRLRITPPTVSSAINTGRVVEEVADVVNPVESEAVATGEDATEILSDTTESISDDSQEDSGFVPQTEDACEEVGDGFEWDEEDEECVKYCEEGEVLSEDGTECVPGEVQEQQAPQGFFPQMIQRGLRILGGLW